jgi:hypothetical protein
MHQIIHELFFRETFFKPSYFGKCYFCLAWAPNRMWIRIPTRGNLFLPVRLLVWADGRGTVAQADSAARAELQEAAKQKLLQLKNIYKNTIGSSTRRCLFVVLVSSLLCNCFGCEPVSPGFILPSCRYRPVEADAGLPAWSS